MKQFWIVIYSHRHGIDTWPVWGKTPPDLDMVANHLEDWEPDREEYLELVGPFTCPD